MDTSSGLDVDVLVIGWGKGGKTLAAGLAATGTRVAMIEQFDTMHGGTCINIGCVPTKTLVHDAAQRREDDDAQQFWDRAVARRDTVVGTMREVNHAMLADLDAVTLVDGRARFVGERTVEVRGGRDRLTVTAGAVVVNTGTTATALKDGIWTHPPRPRRSTRRSGSWPRRSGERAGTGGLTRKRRPPCPRCPRGRRPPRRR